MFKALSFTIDKGIFRARMLVIYVLKMIITSEKILKKE